MLSRGTVLVGFGFLAFASANHCIAIGSAHMGGSPILFSFPGVHIHWLVPRRRIFISPCASIPATVASFVMTDGPAKRARLTLAVTASFELASLPTSAADASRGWYGAPGIYTEQHIAGWKKITDAVHAKGGYIFFPTLARRPLIEHSDDGRCDAGRALGRSFVLA